MSIRLYCNGFWSGFLEKTNPVHIDFFIQLFEQVYNCSVILSSLDTADILLENTQIITSFRTVKPWKHTYLFSGESYLHTEAHLYSCVLYGMRTHKNIVNVPLYLPFLHCTKKIHTIQTMSPSSSVPSKDVLVIIRNPQGQFRNLFLDKLEKYISVTYAGPFRNNSEFSLSEDYTSEEFYNTVSKYKFIITMENSQLDTYITEKITHGFLGRTIPVYWGSPRIQDYFTNDRFVNVQSENDIESVIHTLTTISDTEWLRRVQLPIFTQFGQDYTIERIAEQIQQLLWPNPLSYVRQTVFLCNQEYEPERYKRLLSVCDTMNLKSYHRKFICPTFKHTITDQQYKQYVKEDIVRRVRHIPTRRSELSLTLNTRAAYEYIEKSYLDGLFLIFESDIFLKDNWQQLLDCLELLHSKEWSCINIGGTHDIGNEPFINGPHPYRVTPNRMLLLENAKEDLSSTSDRIRFFRKFHTRCTDSLLFSYKGIKQFVEYLQKDENYGVPFDYYMIDKTETHMDFKYYWSVPTFFDQTSNTGLDSSTIQRDTS